MFLWHLLHDINIIIILAAAAVVVIVVYYYTVYSAAVCATSYFTGTCVVFTAPVDNTRYGSMRAHGEAMLTLSYRSVFCDVSAEEGQVGIFRAVFTER